ncbi:MAG: hypothetical protein ACWGO1_13170, partial [Anaerolineales bacterium]
MKKITILTAVLLVLVAAIAISGMAFAQTQPPDDAYQPYGGRQTWGPGGGMMGSRGSMMGGRWNQSGWGQTSPDGYGPMHDSMISALAGAFNLTPEELEARHDAGETMWDIAQDLGLTQEQFQETMIQARTEALDQAVADGAISQEQADWMLE